MNRREFIRQARDKAALATPLISAAGVASANLYEEFGQRLNDTTELLQDSLRRAQMATREVVARVDRIEFQQQLILLLLVLSFMIDGGLSWALLSPELLSSSL